MLVKATREGLAGKRTASGYVIDAVVPFVALPSRAALWQCVELYNPNASDPETGTFKKCRALVLDIGPHFTDDDNYVFGGARPLAEKATDNEGRPLNGAGIDLGERVWRELGMEDNTQVGWSFVDGLPAA